MLALSRGPATTFARLALIWPPSNSIRPTFVASASCHSRSSLVGSGFRPLSSPGRGQAAVPGSAQQASHPQSHVCVIEAPCLLRWKATLLLSFPPRRDTTRHRTTRHDRRLILMLCPLSLTQPGLLGACISCGPDGMAQRSKLGNLSRTPNLMNRRLLHSGPRRGGFF